MASNIRLLKTFLFLALSFSLNAQSMGVKLMEGTLPNTTLDVNGSVAFREGIPLSIVNGTNNNITIDSMSYYRITTPTAIFTLTGFSNGQDGQILILYNATAYSMTVTNQTGSTSANQIMTGTGANLIIGASGLVTFRYSSALLKWVCTSTMGATSTQYWALTGNSSTSAATNFLGTTDAQDLIVKTNNTETVRLSSSGNLGINVPSPITKIDINGGMTARTAATINVTSDNQTLTIGNNSFMRLNSDGGSASRNVLLTNGLQNGQILMFHVSVLGGEGVKFQNSGNCRLTGNIARYQGDTVMLIWDNGFWYDLTEGSN